MHFSKIRSNSKKQTKNVKKKEQAKTQTHTKAMSAAEELSSLLSQESTEGAPQFDLDGLSLDLDLGGTGTGSGSSPAPDKDVTPPVPMDQEVISSTEKTARSLRAKLISFRKELSSSRTSWDTQQVGKCKAVLGAAKTLVDFPGIRGHDDYLRKGASGNEDDGILPAFIATVTGITDELIVKIVAVLSYLANHRTVKDGLTPERAKTLGETLEKVDASLASFEAPKDSECKE